MLADKLPEVLDFSKDLASLEPASKVFLFVFGENHLRNFVEWHFLTEICDFYPDTIEIFGRGNAGHKQRIGESYTGTIHL